MSKVLCGRANRIFAIYSLKKKQKLFWDKSPSKEEVAKGLLDFKDGVLLKLDGDEVKDLRFYIHN